MPRSVVSTLFFLTALFYVEPLSKQSHAFLKALKPEDRTNLDEIATRKDFTDEDRKLISETYALGHFIDMNGSLALVHELHEERMKIGQKGAEKTAPTKASTGTRPG